MTEALDAATMSACPSCGTAVEAGDQFCEACGAPLSAPAPADRAEPASADPAGPSPGHQPRPAGANPATPGPAVPTGRTAPCVGCGAPSHDIDVDGYCAVCGLLQPGSRHHQELDLGWAAGVTDRGRRHPRNQDAFHLELVGPPTVHGVVAVVCDGVSSSDRAEEASEAAAVAATTMLVAAVAGAGSLADATVDAADAATRTVAAMPWSPTDQLASPACTLVTAACRAGEITVGWVGDSRAYWVGQAPEGIRQLTVDDSWAETQIETGRMTEREAEADPRSHAITRWIGADAPGVDARIVTMVPGAPGRLLLCSDGLWNYAPTTEDMAHLLASQPVAASAIELARSLTEFALTAGGHDNITVVVIDFPSPSAAEKGSL